MKLEQETYLIDTSVPNIITFTPTHFAVEGQFRFTSEETLDEELDELGLRVNGHDFWEFAEMDYVEYEPAFRQYRVWVPMDFLAESMELEVSVVTSKADSLMIFKPAMRQLTVEAREMHKNVGMNFKVVEGIFVEG